MNETIMCGLCDERLAFYFFRVRFSASKAQLGCHARCRSCMPKHGTIGEITSMTRDEFIISKIMES